MTLTRGSLAMGGKPHPEFVRRMAAKGFGVTIEELVGTCREVPLVKYRQVAMAATRTLTDLSYPAVGRWFGDRDHTTVMHGCRSVQADRRWSKVLGELCDEVKIQWAIDNGLSVPVRGQLGMVDMEPPRITTEPTYVFS